MPILKWKSYTGKSVTQDITQEQVTLRRINRLVTEDSNLKRTKGLVTAKLCPVCRMLDDHCQTCGGRGVVPDDLARDDELHRELDRDAWEDGQ